MADPKKLLAYPLISEVEYRQQIDPDQLNRMFRSIEESILRALLRGTEINTIFQQLNLATEASNNFIGSEIAKIATMKNNLVNTIFATGYNSVFPDTDNSINHDSVDGIVTMPFLDNKRFSKIPRYDSDDDGIVDTVSPAVKIYVDDELRASDDPVYNILNRKNDSYWIEQTTSGKHVIEIQLPPSLNKKFNYIELLPFPVFGFDITKIEYLDRRSDTHEVYIPGSIQSNGPHVLHMRPKEFNNIIRITINVPAVSSVMGFTNVDIALIDYQNTPQTFYMEFDEVPNGDYNIIANLDFDIDSDIINYRNYITDIRLVSDTNDSLVVVLDPRTTPQDFINVTLAGEMYLKVTMREIDMTTPVIRSCMIKYTEV